MKWLALNCTGFEMVLENHFIAIAQTTFSELTRSLLLPMSIADNNVPPTLQ
jgi:hypothetical protein